ncbi:MAG: AraC family transcriptional regulator [Pseudomonadales bacterium]|nr:AraC family transcriptional regulator [Pseudomonadales bacterium]
MAAKALHQRVVPETYARLLDDYLVAHSLKPEDVLGEHWAASSPQDDGIDIDDWHRALEKASSELSDPLLGLHLGQTITAQHLGIVGALLMACGTVGLALQRLQRYQRLIFDATPIILKAGEGWVEILWDVEEYQPGHLVAMTGYTVLVEFARSLIRGEANPLSVRFAHPPTGDVKEYESFFGCPVYFNCCDPGLRFPQDYLARPLKSPDPALIALLERHADERLAQLPQQDEVIDKLRKTLAYSLREGEPNIDAISSKLSFSSRTLQRRLREAGTSFRRELNLVRNELAQSYLGDPKLQVVDIALLLGYSEHSAFTRAFREWNGQSPREVREQLGI